jgi:hypothetical protein
MENRFRGKKEEDMADSHAVPKEQTARMTEQS